MLYADQNSKQIINKKDFVQILVNFPRALFVGEPTKNTKTCSHRCKGELFSRTQTGENNPNFNKKWTNEQKIAQSILIKSKVDDEYRQKAGSANRGVKFSKERIAAMHNHRTPESYGLGQLKHSPEVRAVIGKKSREKFTEEFKQQYRQTMENRGHWVPLSEKNDYELYFKASDWIAPMFDIIDGEAKTLLTEHGVFNAFNNTRGVVRDHAFSRRSGFDAKVFPEIMRHPENCNIILHADNVKKNVSNNISSDSITLKELFDKILNSKYTTWKEHTCCITLIKDYQNGRRWKRKEG